jgi:hypothetical protein
MKYVKAVGFVTVTPVLFVVTLIVAVLVADVCGRMAEEVRD